MIDTHCHVDLYPDPSAVARQAQAARVGTIIVTNLPSAYERAYPFVGHEKGLKLALGLHPLLATQHEKERPAFQRLCREAHYIGEVGLDFSPEGVETKELQVQSFRFVLEALQQMPRFVTVHSRRAEAEVLGMVCESYRHPVVFHWYSGPIGVLEKALAAGHYFSVNPAMTMSPHGRRVIAKIVRERLLTETDGPFVQVAGRPALPADVSLVEDYVATAWGQPKAAVRKALRDNFFRLRSGLGGLDDAKGA